MFILFITGGPVVVPVSHMQLKPSTRNELTGIVAGKTTPTVISSPMVIRTQTGSLAVASTQSSIQTPIQLPQINVNKQIQQTTPSASLLQAQLKQNNAGTSNFQQSFTLKTQQVQPQGLKQSELIFLQQKQVQDPLGLQTAQEPQIQPHPKQKSLPTQSSQKQQTTQIHGINSPKSLMNTSILDHSRKRHDFDFDYSIERQVKLSL